MTVYKENMSIFQTYEVIIVIAGVKSGVFHNHYKSPTVDTKEKLGGFTIRQTFLISLWLSLDHIIHIFLVNNKSVLVKMKTVFVSRSEEALLYIRILYAEKK